MPVASQPRWMQAPPAAPQGTDKAEPRWKQAPPVTAQATPKPKANLSEIDAIIEEAAAAIPGGYEAWAAKPADPKRMAALGYTPDPLAKSGYSRPRAPQAPIVDSGQTTNLFTDAMRMLEAPIAGLTGAASGGGLEGWAKTTTQNPLLGATEAVNFLSPVDEAGRAYLGLRDTGAGLIEGDMGKAAQGAQQFVTEGSMAGIQAIPGTMTYKGLTGPVRRTPTTLAEAQRGASLYSVPGKAPLPAEPSIRQTGKTLAAVAVPGRPIRPQAMQAIGRILLASNVPADRVRSGMAKVVKGLQAGVGGPEIGSARPPTIAQLIEREFAQEFPEVTQNIRTVLLERRLANKPKDASPTIIRDAAQEMRGSQVSFLDDSASRNLGGNSRLATSADVEANLRQIGEEGYAPIVYQRAEPQRARQIQDVLNGPGMNELGRPLRQIAAGEGVDIDVMIAQRPIQAAHWMQHKARLLAAENEGTALGNAYNNMRSRILKTIDDLETPDGQTYAQIRARYGDEAGIKDALSAGDRFGAIVNNPDGANRFVEAFERATPEQQAAQLASIRDWAQGKLRRGGEGGTARLTELKNIAVLETLERLGPQGKALADDIRAIRDEEQFLGSFYPNAESATARNLLAAGQGADLYSRPGASSLPVNALADAALMGAGVASAPIMTAMRQGPRLYRGIMQPRTATREDMTRVLMSRPRGPTRPQAPQQARPAGQTNALSAGAPSRSPINALAPARVEPPPLVMPEAQQIGRWEGPPPQKPQSLLAWLRGQGGIKDRNYMTGDLKSVMGKSNAMPGLLNNQSGKGLDELTRAAFQEGFDVDPEDASTLMRLIEEEFSGNPSYRIGAREEWDVYQEYLAAIRGDLSDPPEQAGFGGGRKLPMDEASRNQRAIEQGFTIDAYHGTVADFDEFDPTRSGAGNGVKMDGALFFAANPDHASSFATGARAQRAMQDVRNAAPEFNAGLRKLEREAGEKGYLIEKGQLRGSPDILQLSDAKAGSGENVMPVKLRLQNPLVIETPMTFEGKPAMEQMFGTLDKATIKQAQAAGHDGVIFKDAVDGGNRGTFYVVFDPSNIRGKFATFDPSESSSSKLLAGTGANATGLGGAGGAVAGYIANPTDANRDGVINDDDRGLNAMGGLATGLVGGAGANRLLGPRRGVSKAGPQKPKR